MSTCISKDVSCPSCGAIHKTQMWPGIDRLAHPELRARIMEETFFDWKCPKCGNTDQDKMNVARRTCGYIGTQFWNQGRTQEIRDRVLHL